jgi:lipid II:glycine glycyltransferase (peptidoglycan interpeptide bridge formation enzyme)
MGNKIWRLGIFENSGDPISVALVVKIQAKRGTFLFVPHAPSVALTKEGGPTLKYEILNTLLEKLKKIAKEEKASFIRISPIWERNEENIKVFKNLGLRDAPIHMHAELTWELDITPPEEELLIQMRKTTRYLIRQVQKDKEIEIIKTQNLKDFGEFNNLYQETVDRHHFAPFSFNYLKNEFLSFEPDNQISIFHGKYKNEIVSSAIIIFWQGIGFYHHGASSLKYPKIPASYLLLWEVIREAKNRGCQKFNFWGIAPEGQKNHPWTGLTLFKMGFGGHKKEFVKTQDLPLSKKYWLTFIFEKLRKTKRGL